MMYKYFALLALVQTAFGHGLITAVTGATNGNSGLGFGTTTTTPRDGSSPNPFEQDTSIIRDNEISSGKADACGRTKLGGNNDIAQNVAAASTSGLPDVGADGTVTMTLHQVNQDGAGPYTCEVNADATGSSFVAMTVTSNVPGKNLPVIGSLSQNKATNFTLAATMPAGTTCTGGPNGDACIVRCRNAAVAGPFGGCVAVTNAGGASAASGTAAAAAGTAAAADTAAAAAGTAAADTAAASDAAATATDAAADTATAGDAAATATDAAAAAGETAAAGADAAANTVAANTVAGADAATATDAAVAAAETDAADAASASDAGASAKGGKGAAKAAKAAAKAAKNAAGARRMLKSRVVGRELSGRWI